MLLGYYITTLNMIIGFSKFHMLNNIIYNN
jgi:hypothetical protein